MFQQKETAEDLEEVAVAFADVAGPKGELHIPKLLVRLGLTTSGAEANRKIDERAVRVDGDLSGRLRPWFNDLPTRIVVRLGKRAKVAVIG